MGSLSTPTAVEIASAPSAELVARHRFGVEGLDSRIFDLDDEQLDRAFLSDVTTDAGASVGRWPVRVLLGHLADAELVFVHRVRRVLAEDRPMLALWDEMAFVDSGLYGSEHTAPIAGFVATIHTLRRWQSELFMTLTEDHWARCAMHPEQGEVSLRWFVAYATWHIEHHGRYLRAKLDHMLGPRPACNHEEPQEGGGCGSGAGGGCACQENGSKKDGECCGGAGGGGGVGGGGCGCKNQSE